MAAHQALLCLGFSRQEHWSGLPFPSPMHESEVAQSCPTPRDPMDYILPGSSVHGIFQARVLEWVTITFSEIGAAKFKKKKKICNLRVDQTWLPGPTLALLGSVTRDSFPLPS